MNPPSVTAIVPTYNRARFIISTLTSMFEQTLPLEELILVDDGSTDETATLIESFKEEHPEWASRLRYVRQENQGKSVALNNALRLVKTEWIAFNDSDDTWLPEKLERQFETLSKYPQCGACFSNSRFSHHYKGRDGEYTHEQLGTDAPDGMLENQIWVALTQRWIRMQTMVIRTDAMREFGEFDPRYRVAQDIDLVFRLALITQICFVNDYLIVMDRAPEASNRLTKEAPVNGIRRNSIHILMYTRWKELAKDQGTEVLQWLDKTLREKRNTIANHHYLNNDIPSMRSVLKEGVRYHHDAKMGVKLLLAYLYPKGIKRLLK